MTPDIPKIAAAQRRPDSRDVIDYFGDRQICDRCGAHVSTYGDQCSAPLDVRCEGFETYDRMLSAVSTHLLRSKQ